VTHQMLVDPGETVVLLPVATRYEQEGGGTSTTTERRVAFSPRVAGPRASAKRGASGRVFVDLVRRVRPELADRFGCQSGDAIRAEIARVVPTYAGSSGCGRRATRSRSAAPGCAKAALPDAGRQGALAVVVPHAADVPEGRYVLSTRRGKQFQLDGVAGPRSAHRRGARRAVPGR